MSAGNNLKVLGTKALYEGLMDESITERELLDAEGALNASTKGQIIAALWAAKKRLLLKTLLATTGFADTAALARAVSLLDNPRRLRQCERKLASRGSVRGGKRKLREEANALREENVPTAFSLTRSFNQLLTRMMAELTQSKLEFDLVFFSEKPWATICDLAHIHPSTWQLEHFQATVHGTPPPAGSFVADARRLTAESVPELLIRHPRLADCFSFIRNKIDLRHAPAATKQALAQRVPLSDLIWHFEELVSIDPRKAELTEVIGPQNDAILTALLARHAGSVPLAADAFFDNGTRGLRLPGQAMEPSGAALVSTAISTRLAAGEGLEGGHLRTDSFGKLLERLLTLRKLNVPFWDQLTPLAEKLLEELKSRRLALVRTAEGPPSLQALAALALQDVEGAAEAIPEAVALSVPADTSLKVAVLGDASGSMQCCVEAACIAGCMLTAVFDAELVFFNEAAFRAESHPCPRSAAEVLQVSEEVRAVGGTAPAAALLEFYSSRESVDLFIIVTDEEESDRPAGLPVGCKDFGDLFVRFRQEVSPRAKVLFVSFLENGTGDGMMVHGLRKLEANGLLPSGAVQQVKYDRKRPDLSKFDGLLSEVMMEASRTIEARKLTAEEGQSAMVWQEVSSVPVES